MAGAQQFSAAERERIKYHLGYPSLAAFANIQLGFVAVSQPLFLVEKSMDNLLDAAVPIVREHVAGRRPRAHAGCGGGGDQAPGGGDHDAAPRVRHVGA